MDTPEKTRVAVVFGGGSTEHAISSVGAAEILSALDADDEFEIVPVGVTREGQWVLPGAAASGASTDLVPTGADVAVVDARAGVARLAGIDVVFPVLRGAFGHEGTIQGLLEMADLPYVGSGVFASSAALDRDHLRKLAVAAGLPVAPYAVLRGGTPLDEAGRSRLTLPVAVLPARGHGGETLVGDWADLDAAVAAAREVDGKVVVASVPAGRRVTVGVLDAGGAGAGGAPEASVPGELTEDGVTAPAELPRDVERAVRDLAVQAFVALDCAGLARVDLTVTPAGEVTLDAIDTMPAFEPGAPFPSVWSASGVRYDTLVSRLIRAAVRRGTGLH
ncbi:D-alanine--D-alanine ligase A [Dactylosporangium sucinum]|uniref:D-alanine--D-alanine ligase n=1 Tax=Dactylosporangium sucinum TaxID=1424081 RepID=A0A917TDX4_9ACTN|nr:D-alanine--D-alanine ligase A [Dactylosporangium sucinum]GGM19986.1 D-alanine--D-alanine ligase [Dactylosporangium sucinum]